MDLFELVHDRPLRARGEIVFERFDTRVRSFGERFYRPIRTVANVTDNLMPRRSALREKTITHALHFASYQKLSRNSRRHTRPANSILFTLEKIRFLPLL